MRQVFTRIKHQNNKLLPFVLLVTITFFVTRQILSYMCLESKTEDHDGTGLVITQIPPPVSVLNPSSVKIIQWMDIKHDGTGLRNSIKNADFRKCEIGAQNCKIHPFYLVTDTDRVQGPIRADAVIFHASHIMHFRRPLRRDPSQVFVFAERENWVTRRLYERIETNRIGHVTEFKDAFNWTMSYTVDSDIYFPYGKLKQRESYISHKNFDKIYAKKKHSVVWLVSHCETTSKREDYVREMQKYIDIHIYGRCGNYSCPRFNRDRETGEIGCTDKIVSEYKFYLSFENSYQRNYVTEKLFDWFPKDIVQVVRGGGGDYSAYGAPDGSVIYADKFPSAKELANYLIEVGSSRHKYIEHLKRKDGYYAVSKDEMQTRGYCQLCKMLQDVNKYRKIYNHIGAWWELNTTSVTM